MNLIYIKTDITFWFWYGDNSVGVLLYKDYMFDLPFHKLIIISQIQNHYLNSFRENEKSNEKQEEPIHKASQNFSPHIPVYNIHNFIRYYFLFWYRLQTHKLYFLQGSNLLQIHVAIFPILELSVLIKFSTYNIKLLVLRFVYSLNNENQNLKGCHF